VSVGKSSVSESKKILIPSSVGKQTFSLVATVTNRICAFGFVLNPMSISIVKHSVDKVIV